MTIQALSDRGQSNRELARLLGVTEGAVRYHRRRQAQAAVDGRARQAQLAGSYHGAITAWLEAADEPAPSNVAALYAWLVAERDSGAGAAGPAARRDPARRPGPGRLGTTGDRPRFSPGDSLLRIPSSYSDHEYPETRDQAFRKRYARTHYR